MPVYCWDRFVTASQSLCFVRVLPPTTLTMQRVFYLLMLVLFLSSSAQAQLKQDSTADSTKAPEGFFSFNSSLSLGVAYFRSSDFEATPGFAYEGGVSFRYTYGR